MFDIAQVRADTPSAESQVFLMSAGSSLMPLPVVQAMRAYLDLEAQVGGYKAYEIQEQHIASGYKSAANLINALPDEIAFTQSATAAWQMACYSMRFKAGDIVLTSEAEYGANYVALLQIRQRLGIEIRVVPSDAAGEIDLDALRQMITPRVRLISLTWIPTNGGLTNPAAEVGRIARDHGIAYLLDACQAVGQLPVDVQTLGCDMLSATGRKFLRGPRGTGFLYVRKDFMSQLEPHTVDHFSAPWVDRDHFQLRDDARRYETWESDYVARAGLIAALDYAWDIGMENIAVRCSALASHLRAGLAEIPGARIFDLGRNPSAIVTFTIHSRSAEEIVTLAKNAGIVIGATPPASTRLDAERRHLPDLVRAAPHYFNTIQEINQTLDFLRAL
jgi:selenocysteine lyase/cysteine desulfurase